MRTGWRAGAFIILVAAQVLVLNILAAYLAGPYLLRLATGPLTPGFVLFNECLLLLPVLSTTALMAWLEGRRMASFGLAGPAKILLTLQGLGWGIIPMALLIGLLLATGHASLAPGSLSLAQALFYGLIWLAVSLLIAFAEEYAFRGYLLDVVTRGLNFPAAALLTSALFAALHSMNGGEGANGLADVFLGGLLFCLGRQRTGALWWSIGAHGGWDYAENFLFGAHDSGQPCAYTLAQLWPHGAVWLSGGATGPEGSIFSLVFDLATLAAAWALLPQRDVATLQHPAAAAD